MADSKFTLVEDGILSQVEEESELSRAGTFLAMTFQKHTKQAIADELGISRVYLYQLITKWENNGILEKARIVYITPHLNAIQDAHDKVLIQWPKIIERVLSTAQNSRSDHVALEAAAWLKKEVVDRALDSQQSPGAAEQAYAGRKAEFDPGSIIMPTMLKKGQSVDK